ncbi:helix-turn-helix transcriptional regulator [Lysinibacter sp. HNR]|uniref:helix-turn-helix domain-containing protein n=1 Tax=Lysinibacter sp. HNR TaxID=3031408 RepID=UPI002435F036|nr:helix-turn-helix transcriptional regulator [Lysinibacter sp. HNR]WGD36647.1 helix-turn-helix transcriptional regulator [Lysinibacter sp. HNR]
MNERGVTIGQSLRKLRLSAGMTLSDVAEAAKTSVSYLSKVERGVFLPTDKYLAAVTLAVGKGVSARVSPEGERSRL